MDVVFHMTLLFSFLILSHRTQAYVVSVGVIFGSDDEIRQKSREFWSLSSSSNTVLEPEVQDIKTVGWRSPEVVRAVCLLLKTGIHAFVSSVPVRYYPVLKSYSERFRIPLLTTHAPVMQPNRSQLELTMSPDSSNAIGDLLNFYKWESFVFFYDEDDGPQKLQKILEITNHRVDVDALWRISSKEEAIRYLQLLELKADNKPQCILLATNDKLADEILTTLPSATRTRYHFLLMNPVGLVQEGYQFNPQANYLLTKLSMVDINSPVFKELDSEWSSFQSYPRRANETDVIPYLALLWRDMQEVLHKGFGDFAKGGLTNFIKESIDCMDLEFRPAMSSNLISLAERLKKVIIPSGITGNIEFSPSGERTNFTFNVFETTYNGNKKIGIWSSKASLNVSMIKSEQSKDEPKSALKEKISIVSILNTPYLMLKADSEGLNGNDRYEGYMKDILDEVAKSLNWDYDLHLVKDRSYGKPLMLNRSSWNGMVGELVRQEADVALADLTITTFRKEVLDFSVPVLTIGLNILMKKPTGIDVSPSSIGMFGFLQVWSYQTWLLIVLFYVVLGGAMYGVSHSIGEPDRIRSLDTKLSDKLSLCSSFWFVLGSLTLRSTGIYPKSFSHRMLTIVWWAFSLVLLVIYISSLTFTIIGERTAGEEFYTRNSLEILRNAIEKGHPKLGVIMYGSTHAFFDNAEVGLYKDVGKYLTNNRHFLVRGSSRGKQRVIESDGDFVVILESPTSHYFSIKQPCQTMVSTGFLDHKSFGFAFKKGSTLKEAVDHALVKLMDDGMLRQFYAKWWHLTSECEDPYLDILPSIYSNSLSLKEVSGLFCFLLIGVIAASAAGVFEYVLQSKRLSVDK